MQDANKQLKSKMANGVLWSGVGKVFSSLCSFVLTFVLARAVSPSEYGEFTVALSSMVILASAGTLGMDLVVIRFLSICDVSGRAAAFKGVILKCFGIVVIVTLIVCSVFRILAHDFLVHVLNAPVLAGYAWLLTGWVFFSTLQRQLSETYRGLNDIRAATLFGGLRSHGILYALVTSVSISILWVIGELTLRSALLVMLGSTILVVLTAVFSLRARLSKADMATSGVAGKGSSDFGIVKCVHEGLPLCLNTLISAFNLTGSVWLASMLDTQARVALLGVSLRFVLLMVVPLNVLIAVLPPVVARLHAKGEDQQLERVVRSCAGALLLLSLAMLVVFAIVGRPLLGHIFGSYYAAGYPIMLMLCLAQVVNIGTGTWAIVLVMTGCRRAVLTSNIVAIVAQLLFGFTLGLKFGVFGVAAGLLLAYVVSNVLGVYLARKKLGIWTVAAIDRNTWPGLIRMVTQHLKYKEG